MNGITADMRFAIVPEWVIASNVSHFAFRVYALLSQYADADGVAFPAQSTLAEILNCSVRNVGRAVAELESSGLLTVKNRFVGGRQTSNLYIVNRVDPNFRSDKTVVGGKTELSYTGKTELSYQELDHNEPNQKNSFGLAETVDVTSSFSDDVVALTREFALLVKQNGHSLPQQNSNAAKQWLVAFDRLLRLGPPGDGAEPVEIEEIRRVMKWALVDDNFWPAIIRSASSFREKWSMLLAQSNRIVDKKPATGDAWLEAWGELGDKIRRIGRYGGRPQLPQLLDEYVNVLGGWTRACSSFDAGSVAQRAQFRDWYVSRSSQPQLQSVGK